MASIRSNADIESDQDVRLLVGRFYSRIREDAVLGFIFDDIAKVDWVAHIPTMCDFWETVLFQRPGYKGNPLLPHIVLDRRMRAEHGNGIGPAEFERWITLFHSTVDELFAGPRAELAKRAASRIAEHMISAIGEGHNPLGVVSGRQANATERGYYFREDTGKMSDTGKF